MSDLIFPKPGRTSLLVIDIQERLIPAMPAEAVEPYLRQVAVLLELAKAYEWPTFYSEQYPRGLGSTVSPILEGLQGAQATRIEKTEFSVCKNPAFEERMQPTLTPNVVVVGMETHVCVLQTCDDLQAKGYQVFVPHDGVLSRDPRNKANGLELMRRVGAIETNVESLVFYALQKAGGDRFKHFSKLIK